MMEIKSLQKVLSLYRLNIHPADFRKIELLPLDEEKISVASIRAYVFRPNLLILC